MDSLPTRHLRPLVSSLSPIRDTHSSAYQEKPRARSPRVIAQSGGHYLDPLCDARYLKRRWSEGERSIGMADSPVSIQAISRSESSTPSWFGEVVRLPTYVRKHGVLDKINEQVRFARRRFGRYELIDLSLSTFRLCPQRRTHAGEVLTASPAVCDGVHGVIWARPVAFPFGAVSFFSSVAGGACECSAHALSR